MFLPLGSCTLTLVVHVDTVKLVLQAELSYRLGGCGRVLGCRHVCHSAPHETRVFPSRTPFAMPRSSARYRSHGSRPRSLSVRTLAEQARSVAADAQHDGVALVRFPTHPRSGRGIGRPERQEKPIDRQQILRSRPGRDVRRDRTSTSAFSKKNVLTFGVHDDVWRRKAARHIVRKGDVPWLCALSWSRRLPCTAR